MIATTRYLLPRETRIGPFGIVSLYFPLRLVATEEHDSHLSLYIDFKQVPHRYLWLHMNVKDPPNIGKLLKKVVSLAQPTSMSPIRMGSGHCIDGWKVDAWKDDCVR